MNRKQQNLTTVLGAMSAKASQLIVEMIAIEKARSNPGPSVDEEVSFRCS